MEDRVTNKYLSRDKSRENDSLAETSNDEFHRLQKVFDCIHRPLLWWITKKYGIPDDIIVIIQNLYEGQSSVKLNGAIVEYGSQL